MEEKAARYRCPGPFDIVVEIVRTESGDSFLYRRLFEGEVVVAAVVTPEQAANLSGSLLVSGWHVE